MRKWPALAAQPCSRALTFPRGLRPCWALGPALKGDGSGGVHAGGLSPGGGAGRAGCRSAVKPASGSAPGLGGYGTASGLPSASRACWGDSGNRLPRVVEEIKWITADKAPGSCFCAWYYFSCEYWGCLNSDYLIVLNNPLIWIVQHELHAVIGEGNGNPLHYSCLENPMDRGAWQATVHAVAKVSGMT